MRTYIEVADIFRTAGPAYRLAHAGHLSLHQLKIMSAIEQCRTAAMGGHVEACEDCGHWRLAYNSCRNRHCPKCQGAAVRTWLADREADPARHIIDRPRDDHAPGKAEVCFPPVEKRTPIARKRTVRL